MNFGKKKEKLILVIIFQSLPQRLIPLVDNSPRDESHEKPVQMLAGENWLNSCQVAVDVFSRAREKLAQCVLSLLQLCKPIRSEDKLVNFDSIANDNNMIFSILRDPEGPGKPNLIILLLLGTVFGIGMHYGFNQPQPKKTPAPQVIVTAQSKVPHRKLVLADYLRLEQNMTIGEVEAVLGPGTEIERTGNIVTYTWTNDTGSKITVVFKDKKLQKRFQLGLAAS